jgi:hypothetical protein
MKKNGKRKSVWLATVTWGDGNGTSIWASSTQKGAYAKLAEFCRREWVSCEKIPEDDIMCVRRYFEIDGGGDHNVEEILIID